MALAMAGYLPSSRRPARQDLRSPGVEPGVHPISIELDLMQPLGAVWCLPHEFCELRFDPGWWRSGFCVGYFKPHAYQMRRLTNDGESARVARTARKNCVEPSDGVVGHGSGMALRPGNSSLASRAHVT
jgi:hypothetical protein